MKIITEQRGAYTITTDRSKMDVAVIHNYLANQSYWAKDISMSKVKTAIEHSLNFGLFYKKKQIGYARVISDYSSIAYLGDVFILEEFREQKLSQWLMEKVMAHPDLQGLRRWILLTRDAHELYKKYGWTSIAGPERWMEKHDPDANKKG
jgi:predicted GNAT family N-acyltransferase